MGGLQLRAGLSQDGQDRVLLGRGLGVIRVGVRVIVRLMFVMAEMTLELTALLLVQALGLVVVGLIIGIILGLITSVIFSLIGGVIFGLIAGNILGFGALLGADADALALASVNNRLARVTLGAPQ